MPSFVYEATNAAGQEVSAEIEAAEREEAIVKIRTMGYFPTKVLEKTGRGSRKGRQATAANNDGKSGAVKGNELLTP